MDFAKTLFSPLSRDWCDYYYFIMITSFTLAMCVLFAIVVNYLHGTKKNGPNWYLLFTMLSLYFQNRMYYSMCLN